MHFSFGHESAKDFFVDEGLARFFFGIRVYELWRSVYCFIAVELVLMEFRIDVYENTWFLNVGFNSFPKLPFDMRFSEVWENEREMEIYSDESEFSK